MFYSYFQNKETIEQVWHALHSLLI